MVQDELQGLRQLGSCAQSEQGDRGVWPAVRIDPGQQAIRSTQPSAPARPDDCTRQLDSGDLTGETGSRPSSRSRRSHRPQGSRTGHGSGCIPNWYHLGMSKQIAVRLPDDIVDFIDRLVDNGEAGSRAVVVARAVDRERRRAIAARDAAILAQTGADPDLGGLAEHAARTSFDDLD